MAKTKKTNNSKTKKVIAKVAVKKVRKHNVSTMLNDVEFEAFNRYCKQFKINNKSKMIRDFILKGMWKDYNESYPTLFDKQELADLVIERR